MDRCYFCRGRVTAKKVDHLHRWGEAMLLVKGLPAEVWEGWHVPVSETRPATDLTRLSNAAVALHPATR